MSLYSENVHLCSQMLLRSFSLYGKTYFLSVSDEHRDWQHSLKTWKQITSFKVHVIWPASTLTLMLAWHFSLLPAMHAYTLLKPVWNKTCVRCPVASCWIIFRLCVIPCAVCAAVSIFPSCAYTCINSAVSHQQKVTALLQGSVCRLPALPILGLSGKRTRTSVSPCLVCPFPLALVKPRRAAWLLQSPALHTLLCGGSLSPRCAKTHFWCLSCGQWPGQNENPGGSRAGSWWMDAALATRITEAFTLQEWKHLMVFLWLWEEEFTPTFSHSLWERAAVLD